MDGWKINNHVDPMQLTCGQLWPNFGIQSKCNFNNFNNIKSN